MKPRRTKTPQIKRNWVRGVKLSGNKFANIYLFSLLPRFLPAAVRWLTGSEARPNTFCAAHTHTWAYKLTSNDDETESLTNPKWSCHVCCEELSHAAEVVPRAVRQGRAAVPPGERKTNPDISDQHRRGRGEGKQESALDCWHWLENSFFYLRTQFPNTLIAPKNFDHHRHTIQQTN